MGSSPRVRVQHFLLARLCASLGIIPACAGTTFHRCYVWECPWDHTRVCGYNFQIVVITDLIAGSSPRVRVQHVYAYFSVLLNGIIPACAGTTCNQLHIDCVEWDHPRVCGYNQWTG